ncbi:MAG: hypothetical protein HYZ53_04365 [Planctomycetes bacterium]|nr:hypothetical protein [Planctomycetota bacterium]
MKHALFVGPFALLALTLASCSTAPTTSSGRAELQDDVAVTYNRYLREDPGMGDFLARAYAYVLFPSVGKGGIGIGGAEGWGVVYEQGRPVAHSKLSQVTIGAQLGGQTFAELVVFENAASLDNFRNGRLKFSANASAVAMRAGAAASAKYTDGIAVFTMTKGGLMFEASLGGQQFTWDPIAEGAPAGS